MIILGGFAGHGYRSGVEVRSQALERVCHDCGMCWPADQDALIRREQHCQPQPCHPQGGGPSDEARPLLWTDRIGRV